MVKRIIKMVKITNTTAGLKSKFEGSVRNIQIFEVLVIAFFYINGMF